MIRYRLLYFVAAVACLGVFSPSRISATTKPDFNGTWELDHQASSSLEPLMDKIGAGFVERKLAAVAPLRATFHQSEDVVTVATRAPGFAVDEILYLDPQLCVYDPGEGAGLFSGRQLLSQQLTRHPVRILWSYAESGA